MNEPIQQYSILYTIMAYDVQSKGDAKVGYVWDYLQDLHTWIGNQCPHDYP
jgi:hypothetical protein